MKTSSGIPRPKSLFIDFKVLRKFFLVVLAINTRDHRMSCDTGSLGLFGDNKDVDFKLSDSVKLSLYDNCDGNSWVFNFCIDFEHLKFLIAWNCFVINFEDDPLRKDAIKYLVILKWNWSWVRRREWSCKVLVHFRLNIFFKKAEEDKWVSFFG